MQYEDGIDITEGMSASEIEVLKGHCEERLAEDKRLAETEELQKRMYANTYYWSNSGQ